MLQRFKVPIVGLVENMASFSCGSCGEVHFPFGRGHLDEVKRLLVTDEGAGESACATFQLPILIDADAHSEHSDDSSSSSSNSPLATHFDGLADALESLPPPAGGAVELPSALSFHELPHWPTELGAAEYVASR